MSPRLAIEQVSSLAIIGSCNAFKTSIDIAGKVYGFTETSMPSPSSGNNSGMKLLLTFCLPRTE